jgi:hypothetical protein
VEVSQVHILGSQPLTVLLTPHRDVDQWCAPLAELVTRTDERTKWTVRTLARVDKQIARAGLLSPLLKPRRGRRREVSRPPGIERNAQGTQRPERSDARDNDPRGT